MTTLRMSTGAKLPGVLIWIWSALDGLLGAMAHLQRRLQHQRRLDGRTQAALLLKVHHLRRGLLRRAETGHRGGLEQETSPAGLSPGRSAPQQLCAISPPSAYLPRRAASRARGAAVQRARGQSS